MDFEKLLENIKLESVDAIIFAIVFLLVFILAIALTWKKSQPEEPTKPVRRRVRIHREEHKEPPPQKKPKRTWLPLIAALVVVALLFSEAWVPFIDKDTPASTDRVSNQQPE